MLHPPSRVHCHRQDVKPRRQEAAVGFRSLECLEKGPTTQQKPFVPQAGLVESAANRKRPHQMSSSRSVPAWANKDTAKSALAVVGAAALSVSLFHSLKVLWRTYEQRVANKRLEEYPNPVALCPNSPFFLQRSLHPPTPWFSLSLSLPHPPPHSPRHAAARCNSRDVAHIHILFVIGGAP